MEIDYELIRVYGKKDTTINTATNELNSLFAKSYVEEKEVMAIAITYNVVILYEFMESTGYSEIVLINNKGEQAEGVYFNMDDIETVRKESKNKQMSEIFDENVLKKAIIHMREHNINEHEFIEQYLDELYLDIYESKRESLNSNLHKFFKK